MPRKRPRKMILKGDAVWERMCRQHLTHRKLAKLLCVTRGYLSQILNGHRSPSIKLVKRLVKILDAKFDDIVAFVEND